MIQKSYSEISPQEDFILFLRAEIFSRMNDNIKSFSLVVITICVFIMTVIDILKLIDERNEQQQGPAISSQNKSELPLQQSNPASNSPKTTIKFDEDKFDFGELTEGDVVHHTFSFTNTGTNPLIITNAVGSCGCTVPTYPKEPIAAGGKGIIEVQFNSAGKEGLQNKTVTVSANTDPPPTVLTITSNVKKKE